MKTKVYDDQLIVITGAAGFIGSAVVKYLNNQGFENLLLVDDFGESERWKNLVGKKFLDIVSIEGLFDWLKGREREVEAFIHLGACSSTTERNGDYLLGNNYRYSQKLAEYALENDQRFIYASSAATYGDGSRGFSDNHDTLEDLRPLNLYGYSKHLFDLWLKKEGVLNKVVGLKYFNVFGPNENHKGRMASMVYNMFPKVLTEGRVNLFKSSEPDKYADGDQCRDFIYVKDVARMTAQFLENDIGGIFNIGSGTTTTWNTLATAIFSALEKDPNIHYIDMPADLIKQYQNYTCADMDKYCKLVANGSPSVPLDFDIEPAVKDYVCNYLLKDERW